jgi:sulfotransferase family protein
MIPKPLRVIYIAGSGRTGSTLLERMLGHLPGFLPAGEIKLVWERGFEEDELCSCGQPFHQCPFWTRVVREAFDNPAEVQERVVRLQRHRNRIRFIPSMAFPFIRSATFKNDLQVLQDTLLQLYRSLARTSGALAVVDSSKDPSYAFLLATIRAIELHVVHLVRDSRAVARSWQRTVLRPEVTQRPTYMGRFRPATTAQHWVVSNLLAELLRQPSSSYVRIRYEDLVLQPTAAMSQILSTIGETELAVPSLSDTPGTVDLPTTYHSVAGNPIRFERAALPLRLDASWRAEMSPVNKYAVTAMTLPLLVRYGYRPFAANEPEDDTTPTTELPA